MNQSTHNQIFFMSFVKDVKDGHGEDADPVHGCDGVDFFVGVFDGLGGSGNERYLEEKTDGEHVERTGAYIASRYAAKTVQNFFASRKSHATKETVILLETELTRAFLEIGKTLPVNETQVKSSMKRKFPTTLAVMAGRSFIDKGRHQTELASIWAGDSRNYILDENGLNLQSDDDIQAEQKKSTGIKRFTQDGIINNCICSDRNFSLRSNFVKSEKPLIAISATDGAFGYLQTPIHFEAEILGSMLESMNTGDWSEKLKDRLGKVAGDDVSISMGIIGFNDFSACKEHFKKRFEEVKRLISEINNFNTQIEEVELEVKKLTAKVDDLKSKRDIEAERVWARYEKNYTQRIN